MEKQHRSYDWDKGVERVVENGNPDAYLGQLRRGRRPAPDLAFMRGVIFGSFLSLALWMLAVLFVTWMFGK